MAGPHLPNCPPPPLLSSNTSLVRRVGVELCFLIETSNPSRCRWHTRDWWLSPSPASPPAHPSPAYGMSMLYLVLVVVVVRGGRSNLIGSWRLPFIWGGWVLSDERAPVARAMMLPAFILTSSIRSGTLGVGPARRRSMAGHCWFLTVLWRALGVAKVRADTLCAFGWCHRDDCHCSSDERCKRISLGARALSCPRAGRV